MATEVLESCCFCEKNKNNQPHKQRSLKRGNQWAANTETKQRWLPDEVGMRKQKMADLVRTKIWNLWNVEETWYGDLWVSCRKLVGVGEAWRVKLYVPLNVLHRQVAGRWSPVRCRGALVYQIVDASLSLLQEVGGSRGDLTCQIVDCSWRFAQGSGRKAVSRKI